MKSQLREVVRICVEENDDPMINNIVTLICSDGRSYSFDSYSSTGWAGWRTEEEQRPIDIGESNWGGHSKTWNGYHPAQLKILELAKTKSLGKMTLRDIAKSVGLTHPQQAQHHINMLVKRGLLKTTKANL